MWAGEQEFREALKKMKKSTKGGVARLTDLALKGDPRQDYKHVVGLLCHQLRKTRPQHRWVEPGGARESTRTVPMIPLQTPSQPRVPLAPSARQPSRDPDYQMACNETLAVHCAARRGEGGVGVFAFNAPPCARRGHPHCWQRFKRSVSRAAGVGQPVGALRTGMLTGSGAVWPSYTCWTPSSASPSAPTAPRMCMVRTHARSCGTL